MNLQIPKLPLLLAPVAILIGCASEKTPTRIETPAVVAESAEQLVQFLADAYRSRDWEFYKSLLADGQDVPEFLFILDPSAGPTMDQWGYTTEARIHQRMFEPQNTLEGQVPVPAEYWLTSISITLTRMTAFTEPQDLYESTTNPTGLSPARWKAVEAIYSTDVLFDTQGDLDFQVTGRANFVVIEDLEKQVGEAGKFLLFQWNDLGSSRKSSIDSEKSWSVLKKLYR